MRATGCSLVLVLCGGVVAGAQVPAGDEFRVNTTTTFGQNQAAIAAGPAGDFVIAFLSPDGSSYGIFAQRFDAAGAPRGAEFRVNSYTTGYAGRAAVGMLPGDAFVVVWSNGLQDGSGTAVVGRIYEASGAPRGGEFVVNAYTTGSQTSPLVAAAADGSFLVGWSSYSQYGGIDGIFVRRFDGAGRPTTPDLAVNTSGAHRSAIAANGAGGFLVVWSGDGVDGSLSGVAAQRLDAAAGRVGAEFRVNSYTTGEQVDPDVARTAFGTVVVWKSGPAGSALLSAQRLDPAGVPLGVEFLVDSTLPANYPRASADSAGNFTVTWEGADGSSFGVRARRFRADGAPRGGSFLVNTYTTSLQQHPDIASDAAGNLVFAWESNQFEAGTFLYDTYARRYGGLVGESLSVLDGANGVIEPGENFFVVPVWRNLSGAPQTFQGVSSGVAAPGGLSLTLSASADYGTVPNGSAGNCGLACFQGFLVGTRPVGHVDGSFVETISPEAQGQSRPWVLHVGDTFVDNPGGSFYRYIETLVHRSVTAGCTTTAFCPASFVTREQMAVFVLRSKEGPAYVPPACVTPRFDDVAASSPYCRWIEELARRGVVSGCSPNGFCPTAPVTREQMAVFVLLTLDPTLAPPFCAPPNIFEDVPESSAYCRWIEELSRRGVVGGCDATHYCPTSPVTRGQMAVFLGVTFGLTLYGP